VISFIDVLNQDSENSAKEIEHLKQKISTQSLKKGFVLQQAGESASKVCFVKKGLLRSYTIDNKGKEHIFMFAPEGWIIADGADLDAPNDLFIDTLEDSQVEIIDKKVFSEVFIPLTIRSDKQRTISLIRRISVLQKRVMMLMSASALERYEHFTKTYPQIIQRVPQKMIASYLGITPEALSKVKGDQTRGK